MSPFTISADFPGSNIVVTHIDGDTITLHQERRDTTEWWFHWAFRVRGAAGRTLTFRFTDGDVFTAMGPAFSVDGQQWRWLGRESVRENACIVAFPPEADEAFLAMSIPYTEAHLARFLAAHPGIQRGVLTLSRAGRAIEHLQMPSAAGDMKVLLTARHHACEAMANYVLEGILAFAAGESPEAVFLRAYVDLHIVPFIDKDGVEAGDQGKSRAPHDHNRDYTETPLYPAVRALMAEAPSWRGRFAVMLDLHCPWIRDGRNEEIFFVLPDEPWAAEVRRFSQDVRDAQDGEGELHFEGVHDIPYGVEWNAGPSASSTKFFRTRGGAEMAVCLEFPYALAGGRVVTPEGARAFGHTLACGLARYVGGEAARRCPRYPR